MVKGAAGPGVYSATYSNIPVYEFQFGVDLKEHVMRRRHDNFINATHILKAAGFDKPARTRILERDVQKGEHEKVQGGYGKYQGTWIPLAAGAELARDNNVYEKLRLIFEFVPGNDSPPPAPKHTTNKPKAPKKPAVPKFHSSSHNRVNEDSYQHMNADYDDGETPEDTTVASESFFDEDDRYDMSQHSTGHRKRKREEPEMSIIEQTHLIYADELLDYFMLSQTYDIAVRPEPPLNFQPDRTIDSECHTALHWACAMGDVDVMEELVKFGADLGSGNIRGETPLMRAVLFTNCFDKKTMPRVVNRLASTIDNVDVYQSTALHHAAAMATSRAKQSCARYYIDVILNKVSESRGHEEFRRLLDMQDVDGNTALHIALKNKSRKCAKALLGRGASTDIRNNEGIMSDELIPDMLGAGARNVQASSSPFAPDSARRIPLLDQSLNDISRHTVSHNSEAAMSVESKVTPAILEKFQDLAKSFDEELIDRDNAEKEARRILKGSQVELANLREKIIALETAGDDENLAAREQTQLMHAQQTMISLVEQQQQLRLASAVMHEDAKTNGHVVDDSAENKVELYSLLEEQQRKRVHLAEEYVNASSMAGTGGQHEKYRKLVAKSLQMKENEVDSQLDSLLDILEEENVDMNGLPDQAFVD